MTLPITGTPSKPLPTLPTELIVDIFRNHRFNISDLAHFALVSRRFLSTLQVLLYHEVTVMIDYEELEVDGQTEEQLWRLSMPAWNLLRTLHTRPELAALVRNIAMDSNECPQQSSEVVMHPADALSTFFGLAKKASGVVIGINLAEEFPAIRDALRKLAPRIQSFETELTLGPDDTKLFHKKFKNLRRLKVEYLHPATPSIRSKPVFQLEEYENEYDSSLTGPLPFLDHSAPSLRRLSLNIGLASTLDYSKFPKLRQLLLEDDTDGQDAPPERKQQLFKIWSNLSQATSLEILELNGQPYNGNGGESIVFSQGRNDEGKIKLERLRRIVLSWEIPLDRLSFLLDTSMFPALEEIVVPYVTHRNVEEHSRRMSAARAMCEAKGINLILSGWYC